MTSQIPRWGSQHSPSSASSRSRPADAEPTSTTSAPSYTYDSSLRIDDGLEDPSFAVDETIPPFTTHQQDGPEGDQDQQQHQEQQQEEVQEEQEQSQPQSQPPTMPQTENTTITTTEDNEPRRCWICYSDETEDPTPKPEWRSPCPCALTAHESCLLDWLADIENSNSRRRLRQGKLLCPQCRSEIVVRRPRNIAVEIVRKIDVLVGRFVAPGLVFSLAGMVWAGCCLHGLYSFRMVFGSEMAHKMLMTGDGLLRRARINIGIPLIPILLIFSRTRFADRSLPVFPIVFLAMQGGGVAGELRELEGRVWPPTPSLAFTMLPYLRSAYNICYNKMFAKLERSWVAAVRPRAGELDQEGQLGEGGANNAGNGDGGVDGIQGIQGANNNNDNDIAQARNEEDELDELVGFNLQIQFNLGDINGEDDDDGAVEAAAQAAAAAAVADNENGQAPAGQQQQQNNNANANGGAIARAGAGGGGGRGEDILSGSIADTVLGALVFPAVSSTMGSLLKLILPNSWTNPLNPKARPGLLQSKWGRSVVGGCLFVVFKDFVRLYCRWKIAQSHRKRKVLNYDRRLKRVVS